MYQIPLLQLLCYYWKFDCEDLIQYVKWHKALCFTMDNSEWKHWLKKYILSVFTELFYLIKKCLGHLGIKKLQ